MNQHANNTKENKNQSVSNGESLVESSGESTFQFVDNRPEAVAQRKRNKLVNKSPIASQLKSKQNTVDNSPQVNETAQLQATADSASTNLAPTKKSENNTGLPDNLKTGMENLSGVSLDDVKVHRNSDKPAQLQAHAYAQGTDIHLASGQEKHLPHEAWHVVQQKQGRVKPTMQMKGKVNVNDDTGLEKEADVMGARAQGFIENTESLMQLKSFNAISSYAVQFEKDEEDIQPEATGLDQISPSKGGLMSKAKKDTLLDSIRVLINDFNGAAKKNKEPLLGDLYFATDHWLKVEGGKYLLSIDKSKKAEVEKLYSKIVNNLSKITGFEINNLPAYLEQTYGKGMEDHGVELDVKEEKAKYFDENLRAKFRILVKGGQLYQYPWWEEEDTSDINMKKYFPADSSNTSPLGKDMIGGSGFVMTMGGDLYLARHATPVGNKKYAGVYHSSYTGGLPVLAAGEIKIKNGSIISVNPRSGHYRPGMDHFVRLVKNLKMQGVNIAKIKIHNFALDKAWEGEEFLKEHTQPDSDKFVENDRRQAIERHKIFKEKWLSETGTTISDSYAEYKSGFVNGKMRAMNSGTSIITDLEKLKSQLVKTKTSFKKPSEGEDQNTEWAMNKLDLYLQQISALSRIITESMNLNLDKKERQKKSWEDLPKEIT